MGIYLLRRALLMIPTLVGITFVVFMLIALSPGGIGAGLDVQAGGSMQSSSGVAVTRAKMEDRYGLNEPAFIQYIRWLGRVSPVKLGASDLVAPTGELVVTPRPVPAPAVWKWVAPNLPDIPPGKRAAAKDRLLQLDDEARKTEFRKVERTYVESRARFTTDDALLRDAIKTYLEEIDRTDLLDGKRRPRVDRVVKLEPVRTARNWPQVEQFAKAALASWDEAVIAREELIGAMAAKPYPQDGLGIIPGVLSVAWPDLGVSFSMGKPVRDLMAQHLPVTLRINLFSFPIIYLIAIPSGIAAATRKGSVWDVGLGTAYIGLYSIPTVLAGVLMLGYLATPDYLDLFPTGGLHDKAADNWAFMPGAGRTGVWDRGWLLDLLWHLALPVAALVYTQFAVLSKLTRGAMLDNFNADYVRTAKAKGVAGKDIVFRHVFRNSLLPLITVFVNVFPAMLAGSVVIERIFSVQGMGWLVIEAINLRDRELILANTAMIACVNLLALLLADVLYALADPRITYK